MIRSFAGIQIVYIVLVFSIIILTESTISFGQTSNTVKGLMVRGGNDGTSKKQGRELVLGKDRELVHLSVDLKWVWSKLTDKSTYINILRTSWRQLKYLVRIVDSSKEFKDNAIEILCYIRSISPESRIKLFQGNIKAAEWLALNTGRLVLIYVEDGNAKFPSIGSMHYRNALSFPLLGNFINDQFVFFAGTIQHKATRQLAETLVGKIELPLFAVIAPRTSSKERVTKVLSVLRITSPDLKAENILEFLERIVNIHKPDVGSITDISSKDATDFSARRNYVESARDEYDGSDAVIRGEMNKSTRDDLGYASETQKNNIVSNGRQSILQRSETLPHKKDPLIAVTLTMRAGLQLQQQFEGTDKLEIVENWGRSCHTTLTDSKLEEFLIEEPPVRFTPSNLKRTLSELRLPRSVVLTVVKRTKRSIEAAAAAAATAAAAAASTSAVTSLDLPNRDDSTKQSSRDSKYLPPGAPV